MLDYKNIIIKRYALSLSGSEIARQLGVSKSGVNDFLRAFDKCEKLSYPLPPGITNYGIAELVYGSVPGSGGLNENIEYPDYASDAKLMATRKNMTLVFLWNRYSKKCSEEGKRSYQYKACNQYNVGYFHSEELLESMVALKEQDYDKYARRMKKYLKWELIILDDFLLHTITDEREIKILFELLEKRNEQRKSTIVCSQRDPDNWKAMILNDEVSANSIMKRAAKHYTIKINTR